MVNSQHTSNNTDSALIQGHTPSGRTHPNASDYTDASSHPFAFRHSFSLIDWCDWINMHSVLIIYEFTGRNVTKKYRNHWQDTDECFSSDLTPNKDADKTALLWTPNCKANSWTKIVTIAKLATQFLQLHRHCSQIPRSHSKRENASKCG